jgi:hypothetical protein
MKWNYNEITFLREKQSILEKLIGGEEEWY